MCFVTFYAITPIVPGRSDVVQSRDRKCYRKPAVNANRKIDTQTPLFISEIWP